MLARPLLVAALALGACSATPPAGPLEPVAPLSLYPQPLYFVDAPRGVRYSHPQLAFDSALPPDLPLEEAERRYARAILDREGGNQSAAARALGISRNKLARLLKP